MLTMRADQMGAFEQDGVMRLAREWADEANVAQPNAVSGETRAQLAQRCFTLLREGQRRGLCYDADLYAFVMLSLVVGVDFFDAPPIRAVLEGTAVVHGRKLVVVLDAMLRSLQRRGRADVAA